ncbi:MAG: hypothetical protein WA414_07000 [Acidobacteriaceae bacterium]
MIRWVRGALGAVLLVCAGLYVAWTWHWPLVGDSSLIHYIAFLMDRGWAPYRDLGDMNMPGSFLIEWAAMHTFGGGSLAWRLFDLSVLAAAAAGMLAIVWPEDRLAGVFAAVLFMVVHGRDGINNTGQRDLTMAALVVVAYAFLFLAWRRGAGWAAFLFGFCMAAAGTMKPTALPLGVVLLVALVLVLRGEGKPARKVVLLGVAGFLLPLAICLVFLVRERALGAFVHSVATVVPYFAGLGRKPVSFLLVHSVSPLMGLVGVWLVLAVGLMVADREWAGAWTESWTVQRWERAALLLGVAVMLAGFVVQGKGFPYHRYPFLALLLVVMGMDLTRALRRRGVWLALGVLGLGYGAFVVAPQSLADVRRYDWWNQEQLVMMQGDLTRLGGAALSGKVQCLDTISGCTGTLYRMRLEPATGLLSDFLVFGPEQDVAVREARLHFMAAVEARPPAVIVVTSHLFPSGPGDFQKLAMWPELESWMDARYQLCVEWTPRDPVRWWSRVEMPSGYRIYVLGGGPGCGTA